MVRGRETPCYCPSSTSCIGRNCVGNKSTIPILRFASNVEPHVIHMNQKDRLRFQQRPLGLRKQQCKWYLVVRWTQRDRIHSVVSCSFHRQACASHRDICDSLPRVMSTDSVSISLGTTGTSASRT